jgi:hypothetical protein
MDTKRKTKGIDWKVPITVGVTLLVWAAQQWFNIDLSQHAEVIIATAVGLLAGAAGPAPETVPKNTSTPYQETDDRYQKGPVA